MRLPVAAKIALINAGAKGGTPGSPTPLGRACLGPYSEWVIETLWSERLPPKSLIGTKLT
jgi:hypothetical protein